MPENDPISDEYYPLRWRVADVAEDILLLHRRAVIGVLALIALAVVLIGALGFGWWSNGQTSTATSEQSTTTVSNDTTTSDATTSTTTPTSTSSTTTTTTTTTTTLPAASPRAPQSDAQLAATPPGAIIELSATQARLIGGFLTDEEADEQVDVATTIFPGLTILDEQIVDDSFPARTAGDPIIVRLSAPDLFGYNSDAINDTYLPGVDQLATAITANGWAVEVSGHTDDTGPAPGNLRLSERRAASAAQRLVSQGVPAAQVTSVGRGEDQPIASNDTEAGRLANRRVEFLLSN